MEVPEEETKTPFGNVMIYEELDGIKHVLQFESVLDVA